MNARCLCSPIFLLSYSKRMKDDDNDAIIFCKKRAFFLHPTTRRCRDEDERRRVDVAFFVISKKLFRCFNAMIHSTAIFIPFLSTTSKKVLWYT